MKTARIQNGDTERIELLLLNSSNVEVTGATATIKIRRISDDKYWNGSGFQVSSTTIGMTELDSSEDPGIYYYDFNTSGLDDDTYMIVMDANTGSNIPQTSEIKVGGYVDFIDKAISQVSGGGGGFISGLAGSTFFSQAEKDELLDKIRGISRDMNDVQEGQNVIINMLSDFMRLIDTLNKAMSDSRSQVIESLAGAKTSFQSLIQEQNEKIRVELIRSMERELEHIHDRITDFNKLEDRLDQLKLNILHHSKEGVANISKVADELERGIKEIEVISRMSLKLNMANSDTDRLEEIIQESEDDEEEI